MLIMLSLKMQPNLASNFKLIYPPITVKIKMSKHLQTVSFAYLESSLIWTSSFINNVR